MDTLPAVVLCDLPNLIRQPFIKGGKDAVGDRRIMGCLDNIAEYLEHVLGINNSDKILFGDKKTYGDGNLLRTSEERGWTYVACPPTFVPNQKTGVSRITSSTDHVLKEAFAMFMGSGVYGHYVFISDDGDFIPDMEDCIARGHQVTLFVSGSVTTKRYANRLFRLRRKGVDVIIVRDFINPAHMRTEKRFEKTSESEAVPKPTPSAKQVKQTSSLTLVAEKLSQAIEVKLEPRPTPKWMLSKPPQSPTERFARRYTKP